jgi:metal-dependent HD superfamily phosphatase/phosphodiesterase
VTGGAEEMRMSENRPVGLAAVRDDEEVQVFIRKADHNLEELGYTDHGTRHCGIVAAVAHDILIRLGRPEREAELAAVAGYLHDTGNLVSREEHGIAAALLAREVLDRLGMPMAEIVDVMAAIGNHEEAYGEPVSDIAAALVLGDKSDVHYSRVRHIDTLEYDIHDRVNAACRSSRVDVDAEVRTITLALEIDTSVAPVMEYFEIFLSRMVMCRKAAKYLGCDFRFIINDVVIA